MEYQQQSPGNHPFDGNTLWTMACGTMGGIYKLQPSPELLVSSVTLDGIMSMATYAFVSAIVGYGGKKLVDCAVQPGNLPELRQLVTASWTDFRVQVMRQAFPSLPTMGSRRYPH